VGGVVQKHTYEHARSLEDYFKALHSHIDSEEDKAYKDYLFYKKVKIVKELLSESYMHLVPKAKKTSFIEKVEKKFTYYVDKHIKGKKAKKDIEE